MSSAFAKFAVFFMIVSAAFFYTFNIDEENRVLGMFGGNENNAIRLKSAAEEIDVKMDKKIRGEKNLAPFSGVFLALSILSTALLIANLFVK